MAHIIHRLAMYLTYTLVAAIDEAEKAYIGTIETGVLSAFDVNIALRQSR
jgi:hypothetical protein